MERDPSLGWDPDLAQIYPALRLLLRGGFIAMRRRRSMKGPARREYRVTPAGFKEFRGWLAEPPGLPRGKDPALARLAFLEKLPAAERQSRLLAYRALLAEALRKAGAGSTAARRRRRTLLETELAWVDAEALILAARERER